MADILPSSTIIGPSEAEKRKQKILLGCAGCSLLALLGVGVFIFGSFLLMTGIMKSTDVYQQSYRTAADSTDLQKILGTPIKDGWLPMGSIQTSGGVGSADFRISLSGPNGKGTLVVNAKKNQTEPWEYFILECSIPETGRIINLKPSL